MTMSKLVRGRATRIARAIRQEETSSVRADMNWRAACRWDRVLLRALATASRDSEVAA
jgi:hypothetical protein